MTDLDLIIIALCAILLIAICILIPRIIEDEKKDKEIEDSINGFNKNK